MLGIEMNPPGLAEEEVDRIRRVLFVAVQKVCPAWLVAPLFLGLLLVAYAIYRLMRC